MFQHEDGSIRLRAIESLNILFTHVQVSSLSLSSSSAAFNNNNNNNLSNVNTTNNILIYVDTYLQGLSYLANDTLPPIRLAVCRGIVTLATIDISLFGSMLTSIMEFELMAAQDNDENIAMEACEFWLCLMDDCSDGPAFDSYNGNNQDKQNNNSGAAENGIAILFHYLHRLIPILISRMQLTEQQVQLDRENDIAEAAGKKEIDMKPMHYRGQHGKKNGHGGGSNKNNNNGGNENGDDDDDDDDDGGGNEGGNCDEDEATVRYTVRKRSAAVLDRIGECYDPACILPIALPIIQQLLASTTSCWERESGLMALGAIASGCMEALRNAIDSFFPFLLNNISNNSINPNISTGISGNIAINSNITNPPEVLSISCWVIGRYSTLLFPLVSYDDMEEGNTDNNVSEQAKQAHNNYYKITLEYLFKMMLDSSPRVQSSACSALFGLLQAASGNVSEDILPYLPIIVQSIQQASSFYGVKNNLLLCDFIGAIADIVGDTLSQPQYYSVLVPVIMNKFNSLDDTNMYLFPIMECLVSLIPAVGLNGFQDHAIATLIRCIKIIEYTLLVNNYADYKDSVENNNNINSRGNACSSSSNNNYNNGGGNGNSNTIINPSSIFPSHTAAYLTDINSLDGIVQNFDNIPAKDFAICALDIISSIINTLHQEHFLILLQSCDEHLIRFLNPSAAAQFQQQIQMQRQNKYYGMHGCISMRVIFVNILLLSLNDIVCAVRQSAFSLAGDVCRCSPGILFPSHNNSNTGNGSAIIGSNGNSNSNNNKCVDESTCVTVVIQFISLGVNNLSYPSMQHLPSDTTYDNNVVLSPGTMTEIMLMEEPVVCNNAMWLLGEVVIQINEYNKYFQSIPPQSGNIILQDTCKECNQVLQSLISTDTLKQTLFPPLLHIMTLCFNANTNNITTNLSVSAIPACVKQNAGILLGRIAGINTAAVGDILSSVFVLWCR